MSALCSNTSSSSIFSIQISDFSIKYPTKSIISSSKIQKQQHIAVKTKKIIIITRLQNSTVFKMGYISLKQLILSVLNIKPVQ